MVESCGSVVLAICTSMKPITFYILNNNLSHEMMSIACSNQFDFADLFHHRRFRTWGRRLHSDQHLAVQVVVSVRVVRLFDALFLSSLSGR